jgi:hypothetical protein
MRPYFEYVKGINFTDETRKKLADYVMKNLHLFNRSSTKLSSTGTYDWNWFLYQSNIPTDLMDEVGKRFKIPVNYEILGQTPYTTGRIHIDRIVPNIPPRISLINFPIYPLDFNKIGPTRYWDLIDGTTDDYDNAVFDFKCEVDYSLRLPVIFNLQQYHSAVNEVNDHRFNAQFTTELPFEEIVYLYDKGQLFE